MGGSQRALEIGIGRPPMTVTADDRRSIGRTMFDLGAAMRKKEEFESARLMDFEFRQRVRAVRSLARELGMDASIASAVVVEASDVDVPARIAVITGRPAAEVFSGYARCLEAVRAQLVAERGDPTPHRLG